MSTETKAPKAQAAEVVDAAKQHAQDQLGQAAETGRGAVRRQVDQRSTQAGEQASSVADTLRQTASQLRADGDGQKARYAQVADQAADRLERTGRYLSDADADELLGRVEDVARQQPWLIAGAGLLIGIATARFMKASSRERYYQQQPRNVYAEQSLRPRAELTSVAYPAGRQAYPAGREA
jgi:ElaB/YqjD/DUF883 family membrane-anchored ribosome-binding protein